VCTSCTLLTALVAASLSAQDGPVAKRGNFGKKLDQTLFEASDLIEATLTTNLRLLKRDKGEDAPYHAATLTYTDAKKGEVKTPVRIRTRGIWRLKNCDFPPTRLNFANKDAKGTVWHDLDQPKLVSHCRANAMHEQHVLQEFQLYRILQLLTPVSHQVRLLKLAYADSATGKVEQTRYAFIVEDPGHMAERNGGRLLKQKGAGPDDLDAEASTVAYLFQFLIGNTDFSFNGLHNAELLALPDGRNIPIAYDFDFSGAVNANYATVDPSLPIKRVRERLYRGFCQHNSELPKVAQLFRDKKAAIYALYSDAIGALMDPGVVKETRQYFDDFYSHIATPKDMEKYVLRDCRKN
jgi:hypothetical protein